MCGIFAHIAADDVSKPTNIYNSSFIEKQFQKGKSRGPESSQFVVNEYNSTFIFLGFHRLAINGLDDISNQPIVIDGIYLICNGEIYNYKSLSKHYKLKSNSDCEVIIHLYKEYGIEYLFELLDGVFAFVLYDSNIQKMYVARDPYGVRPLYFHENCGLTFASEIKQIVQFGVNIKQFEPGTFMEVGIKSNTLQTKRYSSFGFSKMIFNNLYDIYGIIYQMLHNSVKKRVVGTTDRPIACLLSGGLDSSTITALVNSFLPKGTLETYSIGLEGSTDLVYAQKVADHLGTKHTSIVLTENEFFEAIPEVIRAIESYDTTTVRASVGNYLVGKYISEHTQAKVIFNGDGADELMGGYRYFNFVPNEIEFDRECKRLLSNIHYFDVLRSDRCISTHGLEPRTPFLDRSFVQMYLSLPPDLRNHIYNNQPEKFLLRGALSFMKPDLLPEEIILRTKEAFSDGVSSTDRSWYKIIEEKVTHLQFTEKVYVHNPPQTNEQRYYRSLFEADYQYCGNVVPYFWMPKYVQTTDPSARTILIQDASQLSIN
jgi:asparagine synthase (glutamine-hydrolysing)